MSEASAGQGGRGRELSAVLWLSAGMLFWAGNYIAGRAVRGALDPLTLNLWRWSLATLVLLLLAWPRLDRAQFGLLRSHWRLIGVLGLLGVALYSTLIYLALVHTTALSALLCAATAPAVIALCAWIGLGDRLTLPQAAGIGISLVGAVVLIARGAPGALLDLGVNAGDCVMAVAVAVWWIYSVRRWCTNRLSY